MHVFIETDEQCQAFLSIAVAMTEGRRPKENAK